VRKRRPGVGGEGWVPGEKLKHGERVSRLFFHQGCSVAQCRVKAAGRQGEKKEGSMVRAVQPIGGLGTL